MENPGEKNTYNKISPTAKITAYWKSLSDIPYAKEISDAIGAEQGAKQMLGEKISLMGHFSPPLFEARYKAIDVGLRKRPVDNVIELACGLSPRGLGLAANNNKYVGTDLPEMVSEISPVITAIAARQGIAKGNLHIQPANVIDKKQLESAVEFFKGEQFAICNEGLLMYLDKEEKATMAQNIRELLLPLGGYWVTTDIGFADLRKKLFGLLKPEAKEKFKGIIESLSSQVGRDLSANNMEDETEAIKFYEELGFRVELYPFYDGSYKMSTLSILPEEMREPVLNALSNAMAWVLIPKS